MLEYREDFARQIYWNSVNLCAYLSEEFVQICRDFTDYVAFDEHKLTHLAATSIWAARHNTEVRTLVVGPHGELVSRFLTEAGQILGVKFRLDLCTHISDAERRVGSVDLLVMGDTRDNDALFATAPGIAATLAHNGFAFLTTYADAYRCDYPILRSGLKARFEELGLEACSTQYFAVFRKSEGSGKLAVTEAPAADLQRRSLFVFGHARSGTSTVFQLMNDQPGILLSYEMHLHLDRSMYNFVANYNYIQRQLGRKISKGFFAPEMCKNFQNITDYYGALLQEYDRVGDKIAIAPRNTIWELHTAEVAFDWFQNYFPFAHYALTLREPKATIAATNRMIPHVPPHLLLESWLLTTQTQLNILETFRNVRVVLFDALIQGECGSISTLLGQTTLKNRQHIHEQFVTTDPAKVKAYFEAMQAPELEPLFDQAETWFARFSGLIEPSTGLYQPEATHLAVDALRDDLSNLIARLKAITAEALAS